jgi:hypothetical protein
MELHGATTTSPMNFSTVPPKRSSSVRTLGRGGSARRGRFSQEAGTDVPKPARRFVWSSFLFARSLVARSSSSETTVGSARVVVSPSAPCSATSRSSRRMIFPERVVGSSGVKTMFAGRAILPIFFATWS